jgi:hypothetical protein
MAVDRGRREHTRSVVPIVTPADQLAPEDRGELLNRCYVRRQR